MLTSKTTSSKKQRKMKKRADRAEKLLEKKLIRESKERPTLGTVRDAFSSQIRPSLQSYFTEQTVPKDVSNLIADYIVDPSVRLKTVPKGLKRRPRAGVAFKEILFDAGNDPNAQGDTYKAKQGGLTDKAVLDILDSVDKKLLIGQPDLNDKEAENNIYIRELNALHDSLRKSQGVKAQRKERADIAFGEKIQTAVEQSLLDEPEEQKVETQIETPSSTSEMATQTRRSRGKHITQSRRRPRSETGTQVRPSTSEMGTQARRPTSEMGTQVRRRPTSEMGAQAQPSTGEIATQAQPSRSEMGTQTKTATQLRREVERDIRKSIREKSKQKEIAERREMEEQQRRVEEIEVIRPPTTYYKPKAERTILDDLFRPIAETQDDREVSNLVDWMVDHVVEKEEGRMSEEKYELYDEEEEEEEVKEEAEIPEANTASSNIGFGRDQTFGDNFMREINANLTGLEPNTLIPVTGTPLPTINDTVDEPEERLYYANDDYEDKQLQNDELEGPEDEWSHADPNEQGPLRNANSRALADNNQYTEAQKAIL
jgi:hypothetical protein